jgi:transcriptional regulator with XRE-family HTH domain
MRDALHFGDVLRSLRESAGLSRAKLAKLARLSESLIKLIERSAHFPSTPNLYRLLNVRELRLTPRILWDQFATRVIESVEPELRAEETDTHTRVTLTITLMLYKGNEPMKQENPPDPQPKRRHRT